MPTKTIDFLANAYLILVTAACFVFAPAVAAQDAVAGEDDEQANAAKTGYLIDVPVPMTGEAADELLGQLTRLAESSPEGQRVTVVLRYAADIESGDATPFEDALKLARAMTQPELRRVKIVSWVEGDVRGHSALPILSSDVLLISKGGAIGNATSGEVIIDEVITLGYRSIASRRGLFPPAVVSALADPALELSRVSKVRGGEVFAAGDELTKLRESGDVLSEEIWSAAGVPLRLDSKQLRSSRIAAGVVDSVDQAAELLDLAALNPLEQGVASGEAKGVLLEITGAIVANRTRRWQSNLASTLDDGDVNTWVIAIDSSGGSLNRSATLAAWFAEPQPPLRTVAGLIRGEARGDAALVAIACRPLYMQPEARLGGPGSDAIGDFELAQQEELIAQIARSTKRPAALIRGLLNPDLVVYRYTNRKTGRIRYATEADLVVGAEDADAERERWERGERIELADGLTAKQAIELGLADGESQSIEDTSRRVGLPGKPKPVADRGIVRLVEKLGRNNGLAFFLLFIGFVALSTEANAPGMGVPGFVAMLCFALYFWMKFLAGTAEWLELIAFGLGIICIGIEIFVIPGFGIFGIGGLALTVLGVVLMSQTFVIPRNVYQVEILTRGIWVALGGAAGMIGGFVAMRTFLPHVPLLRGLVMEAGDEAGVSESEKLADYSHLMGEFGTTTTPLRPSGKAKFGDRILPVVSDGTALSKGDPVRVCEVQGTRIVVEAVEN